jgi:hypothetical protein
LISQHTAKGMAEGDLDPFTKMQFQVHPLSPIFKGSCFGILCTIN